MYLALKLVLVLVNQLIIFPGVLLSRLTYRRYAEEVFNIDMVFFWVFGVWFYSKLWIFIIE